jgi:hypothetical protein
VLLPLRGVAAATECYYHYWLLLLLQGVVAATECFFYPYPSARKLYHIESPHLLAYLVAPAMLKESVKGTLYNFNRFTR